MFKLITLLIASTAIASSPLPYQYSLVIDRFNIPLVSFGRLPSSITAQVLSVDMQDKPLKQGSSIKKAGIIAYNPEGERTACWSLTQASILSLDKEQHTTNLVLGFADFEQTKCKQLEE
jgi:hypothetical protein